RVRVIGPTVDREFGGSGVGVLDLKVRHRRKVVVYGDRHHLYERSRLSFHGEPLSLPESVFCAPVLMRGQEKSSPTLVGGCLSLGGSERPHHCLLLVETGHHPATQVVIKLNAQIAALNLSLAGRDIRRGSGRPRRKHHNES